MILLSVKSCPSKIIIKNIVIETVVQVSKNNETGYIDSNYIGINGEGYRFKVRLRSIRRS